jgi:Sugar (and other) transporter
MPRTLQTYSGLLIFIVHALAKIGYDILFYKVSKNWMVLGGMSIGLGACAMVSVVGWMPESPRYLYSRGRVAEARRSF